MLWLKEWLNRPFTPREQVWSAVPLVLILAAVLAYVSYVYHKNGEDCRLACSKSSYGIGRVEDGYCYCYPGKQIPVGELR